MLLRLVNGAVWRKVDSGLKIVDQTHIALASAKLVVQKEFQSSSLQAKAFWGQNGQWGN